jgi:hypothetical protein
MRTLFVLAAMVVTVAFPASGQPDWCYYGTHDLIYALVEDGTITVHHDAALYNCCPDSIGYTWTQGSNRFTVVETEYNPQCLCLCCFNLTTSMENVPPGIYEIAFQWERLGHPHEQILQVIVPDEGQSGPLEEGPRSSSTCLQNPPAGVDAEAGDGLGLALLPVRPNPIRDGAVIGFESPAPGRVTLTVYSSAGTMVRVLLDEDLAAGTHAVSWDGRDELGRRLPQGVYFCGLRLGAATAARRLIVLH